MNVVSNASSIRCWIVVAKYIELLSLSNNHLLNEGEKVIWIYVGLVSQQIGLVCSTRIKVSKRNDSPVLMNFWQRLKKHLDTCLGLSIWACWIWGIGFLAIIFVSVNASCRWEDEALTLFMFFHHFYQIDRSHHIVLIILHRFFKTLSYCLLGSKMHDSIYRLTFRLVLNEQIIKELIVQYVPLMELNAWFDLLLAQFIRQDELDPFQYIVKTVGHIVNNNHFCYSLLDDAYNSVRPDEPESSRNK